MKEKLLPLFIIIVACLSIYSCGDDSSTEVGPTSTFTVKGSGS